MEYTQKAMSTCIEQYHMLWYSLESMEVSEVEYVVTYVKVYTYGLKDITLQANSRVKTQRSVLEGVGDAGSYFGYRVGCPYDSEVVCLEVKTPATVACSLLECHKFDREEIIISISFSEETDDLQISEVNPNLNATYGALITSGVGQKYFEMTITEDIHGSAFGIYRSSRQYLPKAKNEAKQKCLSGDTSQHITTNNWAIRIDGWSLFSLLAVI